MLTSCVAEQKKVIIAQQAERDRLKAKLSAIKAELYTDRNGALTYVQLRERLLAVEKQITQCNAERDRLAEECKDARQKREDLDRQQVEVEILFIRFREVEQRAKIAEAEVARRIEWSRVQAGIPKWETGTEPNPEWLELGLEHWTGCEYRYRLSDGRVECRIDDQWCTSKTFTNPTSVGYDLRIWVKRRVAELTGTEETPANTPEELHTTTDLGFCSWVRLHADALMDVHVRRLLVEAADRLATATNDLEKARRRIRYTP
jgi:hypothetical protein